MTSILLGEEAKVAKMKQKLINKMPVKEETRTFLSFSRENLNISQSDLEQGFNKHRFRRNKSTILSIAALTIALLCLGLELWKLRYSIMNKREIDELKRDVESLKHRLLEEDLLDELKAFEEKLYAQESNDEDEDPTEGDIDNVDYDSNYDDDAFSSHDYSLDYTPPTYGARPSDFPDFSSTISPVPSPSELQESSDQAMMELLAAVRKAEVKHDQELKKNVKENHRKIEEEYLLEQRTKKAPENKSQELKNNAKRKRDLLNSENATNFMLEIMASKHKRSVDRNNMTKIIAGGPAAERSFEQKSTEEVENMSTEAQSRHPPKKYYTRSFSESVRTFSSIEKQNSNVRNTERQPKKSARRLRKNSRTSRAIIAAHYGADKGKLSKKDAEHFGNGRVRHFDTVFKAWSPSDWVDNLKMNQHFEMKENGSLVVHQDGMYLVYAQIYYIDDRNEAGFHLKVNNQAILQCSVVNHHARTGTQSCFSAQVTFLNKNDILVLQEASDSSRFALLEAEKTFLGLVKLGEKPR
ncbi:TNF superfamily member 12 eiger [Calliopsis andreniformis]|uniref:TNF superfamily member 12 eiger n=1 Tax=Calliopsis andreniformis TaxID=337506 RepID=UPI003FCD30CA